MRDRRYDKLYSILEIFVLIGIIVLAIWGIVLLKGIIPFLQQKIFSTEKDLIAFLPNKDSAYFITFGIIAIIGIVLSSNLKLWNRIEEKKRSNTIKVMYCIISLSMIALFFNSVVFYKDKIIYRTALNIRGKEYKYSDIGKVRIYEGRTSKGSPMLAYEMVMKDLTRINLYDDIGKANIIERQLEKSTPHFISNKYLYVISENRFKLDEDILKRFIIIE